MEVFHLGKAIYLDLLGAMCSKNQANKNINDYARGKNPEVERFRLDLDVAHPVVPLTSNTTEKHITENHKKANNTLGQCQWGMRSCPWQPQWLEVVSLCFAVCSGVVAQAHSRADMALDCYVAKGKICSTCHLFLILPELWFCRINSESCSVKQGGEERIMQCTRIPLQVFLSSL